MRRILLITFSLLCMGVLVYAVVYFNSSSKLNIVIDESNNGIVVDVYEYIQNGGESESTGKRVVELVSKDRKIRLKKGVYVVKSQHQEAFEDFQKIIDISKGPQTVTVKVAFSKDKLAVDAQNNKETIHNVLKQHYPNIDNLYRLEGEQLYDKGEWSSVLLVSKSQVTTNNDTLRAVLKKNDSGWELTTKPPEIIVSTVKYPDIPTNVADSVNKSGRK